ncbi:MULTISPECIES: hypothetical protein [Subtercola]|uniref:Uncharacterized protein n=1 Tax=Subtercola vilae TaxID=2056433 RepID=A0A4T2C3R5_9MICO|nr:MULTISPECIES: hypothetical protein [Subtercola]MEA9985052.1 hypothetical protein [Subtercola sp. RTI3]TIH37076.1 hypothetical protein D4765_08615 [Subtercola vilae]
MSSFAVRCCGYAVGASLFLGYVLAIVSLVAGGETWTDLGLYIYFSLIYCVIATPFALFNGVVAGLAARVFLADNRSPSSSFFVQSLSLLIGTIPCVVLAWSALKPDTDVWILLAAAGIVFSFGGGALACRSVRWRAVAPIATSLSRVVDLERAGSLPSTLNSLKKMGHR